MKYSKLLSQVIIFLTVSLILFFTIKFIVIKNFGIKEETDVGNHIVARLNNKYFSFGGETNCWNPSSKKWKNNPTKYSDFWKNKSLEIKKILHDEKIEPDYSFSNKAVIHFRCSDVPFIKHPQYHLLPKEYYYFISEKIKESNVEEVLFVNCSTWSSDKLEIKDVETLCNNYIDTIADWLGEKLDIKINKNKICTNIKETYSIMMGSKILVSTGGSFSFIPGMIKNKNFISPSNIGDDIKKEDIEIWKNLSKKVHWTMWEKFNKIKHNNINYETFDYKNYK
jgi:hypothetical protein